MLYFSDLLQYSECFLSGLKTTVNSLYWQRSLAWSLGNTLRDALPYGNQGQSRYCHVYVELIRNTPFYCSTVFLFFFRSSRIGMMLSPWGSQHDRQNKHKMTINLARTSHRNYRAGLGQHFQKGQIEAAKVLGLTCFNKNGLFASIFTPRLKKIYPALVSQCIIVMIGLCGHSQSPLKI